MSEGYDILAVSAHLDDAILSCGGLLGQAARQGQRVLVATVCAGDLPPPPWPELAQRMLTHWGLGADAAARRRDEDAAACRRLGTDWRHGPFTEAIYRTDGAHGGPLYRDLEALFGRVHAHQAADESAVVDWLRTLPPARRCVGPLALGGHVDHRWVRAAFARWQGRDACYYEDFPYAQRWPARLRLAITPACYRGERVTLTEEDRTCKCRAVAAYVTQVAAIFGDAGTMEFMVRRHARRRGGERLWRSR
jgi:LmbE family N-acetylglucosaminyl deacetylase